MPVQEMVIDRVREQCRSDDRLDAALNLGHAHRHLLWMARLAESRTAHWLTPSRRAEVELPAGVVAQLRGCTAAAEPEAVRQALRTCWLSGRRYWVDLAGRYGASVPDALFAELDRVYRAP